MTAPTITDFETGAKQADALAALMRSWEITTPTPIPAPAPDASFPHARQVGAAFTKQLVAEEFKTSVPEGGAFLKTYTDWDGYGEDFQTYSKKGYYEPNNVSVVDTPDNYRVKQSHLVPPNKNKNGKYSGTAMFAKAARGASLSFDCMMRLPNMVPGHHIANLMWPVSEKWPSDGEFDYPELDTGQGADVGGSNH
jgi:hypothetical protein